MNPTTVTEPQLAEASQEIPGQDIPELNPEGTSTWEVAALLWSHRGFLARVTVWALFIAILVAFLIPKRYAATTKLMPPDAHSGSGAMLAALASRSAPGIGAFPGDLLGMKNSGALFVDLLQSETVQDRLVDRFNLQKVYWDRYREDARKDLGKRTAVAENRKSGVISITVTDKSPERAAQMAQAYVDELDRLVSKVSTSSARQERIFIEQRLKNVRGDLDKAQREFSEFASKNTALDIKEQTKAMVGSAATLQGQFIAAESELQGLEAIYTSDNVRVRSLRARIGELQRQLQKLGGADPATLSGSTSKIELYPSIRKLPLLGVEWADLYRETRVQETVYELLTQQYELARIEEAKEIPVVHVIDPATVPEKKSFPPRLWIIALGTLFASVVAAASIVFDKHWKLIDSRDRRKSLLAEIRCFLSRKQAF